MMKRRTMLRCLAGGFSSALLGASAASVRGDWAARATPKQTRLGLVLYCLGIRQRAQRAGGRGKGLADPLAFLQHCHSLGAGGIQVPLGSKDEAYTSQLRRQAEAHGMFIEGIASLPRGAGDVERFEADVRTAKRAGAQAIRVVMIPGRRYERFDSYEQFRKFAEAGLKTLQLAEPVAARHRMPLALENHKDQRAGQRLEVFRRLSSEYVGACVDTGNSFALLEDPLEVVRAYAPWAFCVHLKDQAVREYEDGFLLADVPLGAGFLDLEQMVGILRKQRPNLRFSLELITRDALKVPCLTEKYWATLADVPGRDLARTLRTVRANASPKPLSRVSQLSPEEQVEREEINVKQSLAYARDRLNLAK